MSLAGVLSPAIDPDCETPSPWINAPAGCPRRAPAFGLASLFFLTRENIVPKSEMNRC
jgi:hypothetical protein